MNATTKTMLIQCFTLLSMTVLPIIFCVFMNNGLHALIFMAVVGLIFFILYKFPVSCDKCLSAGRMGLSMTRISFWKVRLQYQCDACGEVIEEEIFYPNLTVEVSG